jgi:hypothetical protein
LDRLDPAHATSASLTKLLTNSQPYQGSAVVLSGVARTQGQQVYNSQFHWWGQTYTIDAPPPGKVLWYSFFINWQIWSWSSSGPQNGSSSQLRVDLAATWRWELIANPYLFPEPQARFMTDFGRYESYTSVPPGGSGFNVSWVVPSKSVTLSADSKESDPTPLEMLLATKVDGNLRLWWRGTMSDQIINDWEYGFPLGFGRPDEIYWSCAVVPPRLPDVGLRVPPGGSNV